VSVGVTFLRDQEGFDTALRRSNQALYEAKARGRNQVVVRE
jgi:PleD family two-component response regulator